MRTALPLITLLVLALATIHAQITNPIPAPIVKRGLSVEIKDVVRLPETRAMRPADQDVNPAGWARVSYVRDLPDGRRFAYDSRGFLYRDLGFSNGGGPNMRNLAQTQRLDSVVGADIQ